MFSTKNLLIIIGRHAAISVVVVFITITTIIFLSNKMSAVADKVIANHRIEQEFKKRAEILKSYSNDEQIIGTNYSKIENAFIPSNNISEFTNVLDKINGSEINQIYRFETPIQASISAPFPIETIIYSNNFRTDISGFLNYLKEFEKLPYFTKIDEFSISSQDKIGWQGPSSITFKATLFTREIQ